MRVSALLSWLVLAAEIAAKHRHETTRHPKHHVRHEEEQHHEKTSHQHRHPQSRDDISRESHDEVETGPTPEYPTLLTKKEDSDLRKKTFDTEIEDDNDFMETTEQEVGFNAKGDQPYIVDYHCDPGVAVLSGCTITTNKFVACWQRQNRQGACVPELLREKDEYHALHNPHLYSYAVKRELNGTDMSDGDHSERGMVVQDFADQVVRVDYLPGDASMMYVTMPTTSIHTECSDLSDLKSVIFENKTLPDGLGVLRMVNVGLTGYPEPGQFSNITLPKSVFRLNFRRNKMTHFDPKQWLDVPLLEVYLERNSLTNFGSITFPQTIRTLDIRSNLLTGFNGTKLPQAVEILQLANNKLENVRAIPFSQMPRLSILSLQHNMLVALSADDVLPDTLTVLDLSMNKIATIEDGFRFPPKLVRLELSENNLTSISHLKLPASLRNLSIYTNPIVNATFTSEEVARLRNISIIGATPDIQCPPHTSRTYISDTFFICEQLTSVGSAMLGNTPSDGKAGTSVVPIVLGCVAGMVVVTALAVFFARRTNAMRGQDTDFHFFPQGSSKSAVERASSPQTIVLYEPSANDAVQREDELITPVDVPPALKSWKAFLILPTNISDVIPVIGGGYCAVYNSERVLLTPLLDVETTLAMVSTLVHPSIVRFIGVTYDNGERSSLLLVTELQPNGSLDLALTKRLTLTLPQKLHIALNVLEALVYLHGLRQPLAHLALSSHMIFLSEDFSAKVKLPYPQLPNADASNELWTAPEVFDGHETIQADMYSFGVLLSTLDREALPSADLVEWFRLTCPVSLRDLGLECLQVDPSQRPTASDALIRLRQTIRECDANIITLDTFSEMNSDLSSSL
ncbi:unnamed protein product [Aphanomyces euteiches]|nr:hypothetical protein AeRB84_010324 [Aphanomyces euteiches]